MPKRAGVVGLGIMGSAYAGHLIDAAFPTTGFDVAPEALRRFAARGGRPADTARAVARDADVLITALPSTAAMDEAFFGDDGIVSGAHEGLTIVEASTFPLEAKERVRAVMAERGVRVLDAPVSGTGSQARVKDIAFYASGERAAYDAAEDVLTSIARSVRYVGEFGTGSKLKYIANLLVTIHNLSTAEAIVFALKAGLDPAMMLDVIRDGAGGSRMLDVRGPMMVAGSYDEPTMKLDVYQKDIDIIADFAREIGAPTPLFSQSAVFYAAALAQGRGKQDTAAIASVLKTMAGLAPDP
jgi:3-hydroxyisobutyrate dehydrogenase-like beta-hydroxyacid dehydrogenase